MALAVIPASSSSCGRRIKGVAWQLETFCFCNRPLRLAFHCHTFKPPAHLSPCRCLYRLLKLHLPRKRDREKKSETACLTIAFTPPVRCSTPGSICTTPDPAHPHSQPPELLQSECLGLVSLTVSHRPSSSYTSHLAAKAIHISLSEAPQLLAQQQLAADVRDDELARGLSGRKTKQ